MHDDRPFYVSNGGDSRVKRRFKRYVGAAVHLFYFSKFKQWAIGPNLGKTPVYMYVTDTASTPDRVSIIHEWYAWDGHFWQVEPAVAVDCK
jgi:hypothetical protein